MRTHEGNSAGQSSMLKTVLAGAIHACAEPPSGAVRRHRLDDVRKPGRSARPATGSNPPPKSGEFTASDKALIRKVHGYMAPLQLLGILNERLVADHGDAAVLYSIEQLKSEIDSVATALPATGNDWGSLRKVLAKARRNGVLARIDEQVINDFAVVYSLNQKQVLTLKDILLNQEGEE